MLNLNEVYLGDCIKVMKDIDNKSIDMILTDLPYNMTKNKWDQDIIPLDLLWNEYKRIINQYAFVFFDAPPSPDGKTKIEECEFFQSRTPIGGVWVFDDVGIYQHDNVHQRLINEWGFEIFQKGWKWSYKKTK